MPEPLARVNLDQPADPAVREAELAKFGGKQFLINLLDGYRNEAENDRKTGANARDQVWEQNWDLYWGRIAGYEDKASWQSKEVMPEPQQLIHRWTGSLLEALNQPGNFFTVKDEGDKEDDLTPHIMKFMKLLLSECGRTSEGYPTSMTPVLEECFLSGAITSLASSVTWKQGLLGGYVAFDAEDARQLWLDPKRRGMYRFLRYRIDKHELAAMATNPEIWDVEEIKLLQDGGDNGVTLERERSSGHTQQGRESKRKEIIIDEFLATLINENGELVAHNQLCVVANDRFLIRGPEKNPFEHGRDWVVSAPMVPVPFSPYGRSYMENWSSVARTFIHLTNLVVDGVFTTAMKSFAVKPALLEDPDEIEEGMHPNKLWQLLDDADVDEFMKEIDLGRLDRVALDAWTAFKNEVREGGMLSELNLGQIPPKGDITATEITEVQQGSTSAVRSMARSIETRFMEPNLTLMWHTGLQHFNFADPRVIRDLGEDTARMLGAHAEEFSKRVIRFRVTGISEIIERGLKLRRLMNFLAVISQNEQLFQQFVEKFDVGKLFDHMVRLFGIDVEALKPTERERLLRAAGANGISAVGPAGTPAAGNLQQDTALQ
ncbi:MAG: hypothetical protein ACR2QC_08000 [Gammaproteobacteria bacterium]